MKKKKKKKKKRPMKERIWLTDVLTKFVNGLF